MVKAKKSAAPKKKMGRPPVSDEARRDVLVRVLVAESEHGELQAAATSASLSVSAWMRSIALDKARAVAAEKAKQDAR